MQAQFVNKTTFTSPVYSLDVAPYSELAIQVNGKGPVKVECEGMDGVWRSWPETVFEDDTAQILLLPKCKFRVVFNAAAATTVSIQW